MRKYYLLIAGILFGISSLFVMCEKTDSVDTEIWNVKSEEVLNVRALNAMEGLTFLIDTIYTSTHVISNPSVCPVVTYFTTSDPNAEVKYITTYNWPSGGCIGPDGITRKGQIVVSYTNKMDLPGSVELNTFYGFVSDGNRIAGFQEIKYKGPNQAGKPVYEVYSNLEVQIPGQLFANYKSTFTRTLIEGSQTLTKEDDVWQMTGTLSGATVDDIEWTAVCGQPLIKKGSCRWFDSGTLVITPEIGIVKTIDFGNGDCDNKATVSTGSKVINVEL